MKHVLALSLPVLMLTSATALTGEVEFAQRYGDVGGAGAHAVDGPAGRPSAVDQRHAGRAAGERRGAPLDHHDRAQVQALGGGSITSIDRAQVRELGSAGRGFVDRAQVQELGGGSIASIDRAQVRELGSAGKGFIDRAQVQELGGGSISAIDRAQVQELGSGGKGFIDRAQVQELGGSIKSIDRGGFEEVGGPR